MKKIRVVNQKITDAGRFNNIYDTVDIVALYGNSYDIETLRTRTYRTMALKITMDIREVNDGYQYIFIYDDRTTSTYLSGCQIEHGGSGKKTEWESYTFYIEIDLFNITENDFVIRYGASGKESDDWNNKNIEVQIGFSKEPIINDSLIRI